ncbi:SSU ribosomal protein S20P [Orenia metallireducens]|uniref:Small ribosomal subunit protein bS20 n=1 Tax=Orenia metallireducens TaxID=1413210 RepID=A0A285G5D7_9FIRM|nr:30S ribosomal protein S20 [Orenia metallireducens]PRX28358.1 SSU ribosomal protein S20P [Orenia metallireducens]SNY18735.1 SSU ribosomal protein S20P [Orenia metallireducens]
MANSKSAQKRIRIIEKKTAINKARKSKMKTAIRRFEEAVAAGDVALAQEKLNNAKKVIDKTAAKGTIHKNNAARKKSKLEKKFNELTA